MGPDGRGHRVRNRLGGPHDEHGRFKQARVQRLQMKSACARTTPVLSRACAYASSGSRFKAKNCPPQVNFDRIARASSGRPKMTSAAANASTDDRTSGSGRAPKSATEADNAREVIFITRSESGIRYV